MTKRTSILPRSRACAAALTRRAPSSWAAVGSRTRRFTRAQPTYCVLASSRRSAASASASATISSTCPRFSRCNTTLSVSGNPSSLTQRATWSFRSKTRAPATRSELGAATSWMETCTLSSPRERKRARRSRVGPHQAALGEGGQERHDVALHLHSRLGGVLLRETLDDRVDRVLASAERGDVGGRRVQHEAALGVQQEVPRRLAVEADPRF